MLFLFQGCRFCSFLRIFNHIWKCSDSVVFCSFSCYCYCICCYFLNNDNNEKRFNFQVDRTVSSKTRFASVVFCVVVFCELISNIINFIVMVCHHVIYKNVIECRDAYQRQQVYNEMFIVEDMYIFISICSSL